MDRRGMLLMFIGAIFIAVTLFINLPVSLLVWTVLFVVGLLIAATGTIMCIVTLAKSIKADYDAKKHQ